MDRRSATEALNTMKVGLKNNGSFPMACGLTALGSQAVALMEDLGLNALPAKARKLEGDNDPTIINDWMKRMQAPDTPPAMKTENLPSAPKPSAA